MSERQGIYKSSRLNCNGRFGRPQRSAQKLASFAARNQLKNAPQFVPLTFSQSIDPQKKQTDP